jgi:L-asparagine transporter-like permease
VNDKSYESSDGNMGGAYVSRDIAESYNILASGISIITILCFVIIFIVGLNTRNKKRENISIVDKKPKTLLMIGLSLLLLVFLLISMIMFVMSSNFAVSYQE